MQRVGLLWSNTVVCLRRFETPPGRVIVAETTDHYRAAAQSFCHPGDVVLEVGSSYGEGEGGNTVIASHLAGGSHQHSCQPMSATHIACTTSRVCTCPFAHRQPLSQPPAGAHSRLTRTLHDAHRCHTGAAAAVTGITCDLIHQRGAQVVGVDAAWELVKE
jgi:hypothetical protein